MDVAQALANLTSVPQLPGTLSLPGPSTLTYEYLLELVSSITYQPPSRAPVLPKAVATILSRAAQAVWWPALCPDEITRRYIDDADTPGDWAAVGVEPSEIENHAITYLRRYRSAYVTSALCCDVLLNLDLRENFVRPIVFPPRPAIANAVSLSSGHPTHY